jgi:hypothetical protein
MDGKLLRRSVQQYTAVEDNLAPSAKCLFFYIISFGSYAAFAPAVLDLLFILGVTKTAYRTSGSMCVDKMSMRKKWGMSENNFLQ